MHMTADSEVVREFLQGSSMDSSDSQQTRGAPLGTDDTGTRYYQLAADSGLALFFICYCNPSEYHTLPDNANP